MNEVWAVIFGNNSVAITPGEIQIRPGLGRHQLIVPISVRPTAEAAYGHSLSFDGSIFAGGLRGGGGYVGRINPTSPRILQANSQIDEYLAVDIDPPQISLIEAKRDGGFSLDIQLEISTDVAGAIGSAHISGHPVARETWLRLLEQIQYQRTLIVELPVPSAETAPRLSRAVNYFANSQRRFLEGDNRNFGFARGFEI